MTQTTPEIKIKDYSLLTLLLSNLFTILIAYHENWSFHLVLWIYWFQSVTIGVVNFFRMWQLKNFSTEGLTSNGHPVEATEQDKHSTAVFFAFHYGFFHLIYFVFLFAGDSVKFGGPQINQAQWWFVLIGALVFVVNHCYSFWRNRVIETNNQNLGVLLFYPYARVVPMHLGLVLGAAFLGSRASTNSPLIFFLLLKTLGDLVMHSVEHKYFYKSKLA